MVNNSTRIGKYDLTIDSISFKKGLLSNYQISFIKGYITIVPIPLQICMITIDSASGKNMVVWERRSGYGIQYYNVYRESEVADQYDSIGSVNFSEISLFVDTGSYPENQQYRYKISAVDSSGHESVLSKYHQPLFLQFSSNDINGINLSLDPYLIEGSLYTFDSWVIYRGTDSTKLSVVKTISANFNSYTDTDPQSKLHRTYYRVAGVRTQACSPANLLKAESGPFIQSISNIEDNRLRSDEDKIKSGISGNFSLIIYPRPADDMVHIVFQNELNNKITLQLYNLAGILLKTDKIALTATREYTMPVGELNDGVYILKLSSGDMINSARIIIKH